MNFDKILIAIFFFHKIIYLCYILTELNLRQVSALRSGQKLVPVQAARIVREIEADAEKLAAGYLKNWLQRFDYFEEIYLRQ